MTRNKEVGMQELTQKSEMVEEYWECQEGLTIQGCKEGLKKKNFRFVAKTVRTSLSLSLFNFLYPTYFYLFLFKEKSFSHLLWLVCHLFTSFIINNLQFSLFYYFPFRWIFKLLRDGKLWFSKDLILSDFFLQFECFFNRFQF